MFERKKVKEYKTEGTYARDLAERQLRWREAKQQALRKVEEYIEFAHRGSHDDEKKEHQG
jgi:hypothetical protein